MCYRTTLVPERSIRVYRVNTLQDISNLTCGIPLHSRELEAFEKQLTVPRKAKVDITLTPKGDRRKGTIA